MEAVTVVVAMEAVAVVDAAADLMLISVHKLIPQKEEPHSCRSELLI